ncbi:MAG TPA: ABC transporter substrate-binding protein [Gemmatimonadaceae bacterium]|nr:ABC transporter substrate-binding protein [Gemmatimonadaceae bacterium]
MPRPSLLAPLAVLALLAGGCRGGGGAGPEPIVVGVAGPWQEGYGQMARRGVELALAEINAGGGVGGRPLTADMRDDGGDGARAARIAGEFVANRALVAVVGHVNSGAMMAAARVYDGGLPAVATTASSPDLSGISPWAFRVISSDSVNGIDLARFARTLGPRAAILYENDAYGRGLAEAFQRHFGGEIIGVDPISSGDGDFEPFISFYQRRRPDVVFVAGTDASGLAILREAKRQHLRAAFLGGDGWSALTRDTATSEGAFAAVPFTPADPRPDVQGFVAAFRERYDMEPDGNAALSYDATRLLARAIGEVGPDRAALRDWLAGLRERGPFRGVTGPIAFNENGDVVGKGFVMTRISRGALTVARR